jgi:hypothetical protein
VAEEGFAPPTQAFSGLCSTPELLSLIYPLKIILPLVRS